jgi:hypothetical protein
VKNAAAHGDLNDTQLEEYNIECQGHTTRMGKKAYNFSREPDRAKTLQQINDMINKKYQVHKNVVSNTSRDGYYGYSEESDGDVGNCSGGVGSISEEDISGSEGVQQCVKRRKRDENYGLIEDILNVTKRKHSNCDQILIENHDDWGKKHPFYQIESLRIKWSPFEKDYIKALYDKNRLKHNVWRHCLDSILNTNDENVRQQFHISHLAFGKLKDAIRVKKERN